MSLRKIVVVAVKRRGMDQLSVPSSQWLNASTTGMKAMVLGNVRLA
jgi:hypothetical protein